MTSRRQGDSFNQGHVIDELDAQERTDEVPVLFTTRDEFRCAEVMRLKAPASELWLAGRGRSIGVLHPHKSGPPSLGQYDGREIDAVNAEAVLVVEWGPLTGHAFKHIRQTRSLLMGFRNRQDIAFARHRRLDREVAFTEGPKDCL